MSAYARLQRGSVSPSSLPELWRRDLSSEIYAGEPEEGLLWARVVAFSTRRVGCRAEAEIQLDVAVRRRKVETRRRLEPPRCPDPGPLPK